MRHAALFITVLLLLTTATATAAPISVLHVTDPRLPALSPEDLTTVLSRARTLIREAGGPEVSFVTPTTRPAAQVQADLLERRKPLLLEFPGQIDPATVKESDITRTADAICRAYGTVPEIRSLLGMSSVSSYAELARALSHSYITRLQSYAALKTSDGAPVISGDAAMLFRISTWCLINDLAPCPGPPTLTIYNGFTYEDGPQDAGPHSLYTAQAFGVTQPPTGTSFVAYHFLLRTDLPNPPHRLGQLTPDQRLDAIAYVIAHEVGNHLLLNLSDDFAPTASIARPLASLSTAAELHPKPTAPGLPTQKRLPADDYIYSVLARKADLAIARKEVASLNQILPQLAGLKVSKELGAGRFKTLQKITTALHELDPDSH